ncbi:MAG: hypothetical protein JRZ94_06340, partial [Nitrososphaerota archaeon]|nr:hypothetical protein [Nitrososphaerota archaeon]
MPNNDSSRFTINAIPKISGLAINTEKSDNAITYDFASSNPANVVKAITDEKIQLQITLDYEEASKRIIHVGVYTNIGEAGSSIKNSNAYVI